jgi:asparagine synthase (glutamine-hydrolysing)
MCGIFGAVGNSSEQANIAGLTSFAYRGPDHTGYSTEHGVFLGNNRLSVIDLDERSNQPVKYITTKNCAKNSLG